MLDGCGQVHAEREFDVASVERVRDAPAAASSSAAEQRQLYGDRRRRPLDGGRGSGARRRRRGLVLALDGPQRQRVAAARVPRLRRRHGRRRRLVPGLPRLTSRRLVLRVAARCRHRRRQRLRRRY